MSGRYIVQRTLRVGITRYAGPASAFRRGRGKFGEFPLVVAREYFRSAGYVVLASEPLLEEEGFICISYPGKRRANDPSYRRMEVLFGSDTLAQLNALTDVAKRQLTSKTGWSHGGDPDLFAYRADNPRDRFFVEVKDHDHLTNMQKATFPLIHKLCPIIVARIEESP